METGDEDNFTQCGNFFRRVLTAPERERLTDNVAGHLCDAQPFIRKRVIHNLAQADPEYGRMVSDKVDGILRDRRREEEEESRQRQQQHEDVAAPLNPPRRVPRGQRPEPNVRPVCPHGYSSKL